MKLQESITGFFYVGNNRDNITKLVNIYKRGYASGNLNQALSELTRSDRELPEAIFCESRFGYYDIQVWADRLANHPKLAAVPLIIDAEGMCLEDQFRF